MRRVSIPTKETISETNQVLFSTLEKSVGFVPNMYAVFAHSPTALEDYLALQNRKTSLSFKEKEIINLIVSQLNGCDYCKSAHTEMGKMAGFTDEEILEIRKGNIRFDSKLNELLSLTKKIVEQKGKVSDRKLSHFFEAGYTTENLVDIVIAIGDKIITNYLFALVKVPIDFPIAKEL